MVEIILVRHGETDWNVTEVFRGGIDIELSENGLKQVELLAEYLRNSKVAAIYSSPLKRASKTAEIIAGCHNLDVVITLGLIDFNYGEWQGLPHEAVKDRYGALYAEWTKNPHRVKMPAGESLSDVRRRVSNVVASVIASNEGTVVMVAHRVVNKVLICYLLGLGNAHFWNIRQDTCGITIFNHNQGRFVLVEHNNTSYLKSLQKAPLSDF